MNRILFSLLLSIAAAIWVRGEPDVPPDPRIKSAPAPMVWTIDYQYSGPNPYLKPPTPADAPLYERMEKEHPQAVSTKVIKSRGVRMDVTVFDDNTKAIVCVVGDLVMTKDRRLPYIEVCKISENADVNIGHDFYSLEWVNQAAYKGHQDFQSTTCCTYYLAPDKDLPQQTAYIDAKTGLPSGIVMDGLTTIYKYSSANEAVELPSEFTERLKKYQQTGR